MLDTITLEQRLLILEAEVAALIAILYRVRYT
jgi:hypothetical protein